MMRPIPDIARNILNISMYKANLFDLFAKDIPPLKLFRVITLVYHRRISIL